MSSSFSSLSSSLIARQIARVSRPRPWIVPALVVKPAPVVCSTTVPSSSLSSLSKPAIARVAARVCRSQTLSSVSSFSSSKRPIVGGRQIPVNESGLRQTTLSARASARASRDRPWLQPRSASIATKVSQSKSKTAQWIKSQAIDLRRPSQASRQPSSTSIRHSSTSNTSMAVPAPQIVLPKRRTAATGPRQAVRYPSTSNNRPAPSSSSSRPQQVAPASPDNSIAAIVREAWAFDINQFRAEVEPLYQRIEAHRQYLRRLTRKPVTFDDKPTVISNPRWIDKKEHVHPRPSRILGQLLAWRPLGDSNPYEHTLVWGSDSSNFDHSDCDNPGCHRRAKDLYMDDYEEWTAPTFTTISE
ncbi:hypothetical protein IMSHALPRED_001951 [Imshaugia aleurites]|uniref:Uncharacterized protein n=1 Tax=Imshaugia aleurites TaxID=172621 RepID=A0A8H3EXX9_9LECA|nr:hypothetical protein IMSHALPRED_001951 [Imshaugia aleurites]